MKIDEKEMNALLQRINASMKEKKCPLCGNGSFSISDTIFELREFNNGNMVVGGNQSLYPVVPLSCNTCGNTYFLNAIKLDLIKVSVDKGGENG